VSAIVGVLPPARRAFAVLVVVTLLTLVLGVALSGSLLGADWLHLIPLILLVRTLGVDMIGLGLLADALGEVHAARAELARMAVMEERLRLARDLHDLLGHNLSLITLKSELAGRLVEAAPARAAAEIQEVERAARQTLREVREAVAGYRQPARSLAAGRGNIIAREGAKRFLWSGVTPTVMAGWSRRRCAASKIVAILKAGIDPSVFPIYQGGAAHAQAVGRRSITALLPR
jgi:Histidine kinase